MILFYAIAFLPLSLAAFDWKSELKPQANFQILGLERWEPGHNASEPQASVKGGIFPSLAENLRFGLELTTTSPSLGSEWDPALSPGRVVLSHGMSDKPLGLSQFFLAGNLEYSFLTWEIFLGKFESPLLYSPLMWDELLHPEGLLQSADFHLSSRWRASFFSAQFSADQTASSLSTATNLRRSWIFEQGFLLSWSFPEFLEIDFENNSYFYYHPSERLAEASALRGNTLVGTIGNHPLLRYEYFPVESIVQLIAYPLAIQTILKVGGAMNFRTPDLQRSFFIEAALGNAWKKDNCVGQLSYYYNEPNTTLAFFSSALYGYTNRKGPRFSASYFPMDHLRVGASFAFLEPLALSSYQSDRKDLSVDFEYKFF